MGKTLVRIVLRSLDEIVIKQYVSSNYIIPMLL